MAVITNSIDGDTFRDDEGAKVRLANVDTPESVHPDEHRNTEAGAQASAFSEDFVRGGVQTHDFGKDHFGRKLSTASKNINGVDIDMQLVLMDQGYTTYQTRFNKAKDPALHDEYTEYFAKNSPYQYGTVRQPMSRDDYEEIHNAQKAFSETYSKFKNGDATQEEFDQAIYNLYKDPQKVAHYRYTNAGWGQEVNAEDMGNSDRESIMFAIQSSPEFAEQYNRAVRNSHLTQVRSPEKEKSFWEKLDASFSQLNSVANVMDHSDMVQARSNNKEYDIDPKVLTQGVEQRYHSMIMEEVDNYGEAAGLQMRDQLIEDIANNKIFDNLDWYAQFGYGALAIVADPLTILPAGKLAQGVNAANKQVKMFQISQGIEGSRLWAQSRAFENTTKMTTWAGAGMVETAIQGTPRLSGDHTYTARDLTLDIAMGGVFGSAFGGIVETGKYYFRNREAAQKVMREQEQVVNNPEAPKHNNEDTVEKTQEAQNAAKSQETVSQWTNDQKSKPMTDQELRANTVEWAAIDKVSTQGFQAAGRKIRNLFPKGSPMHRLINSQIGFNDKKLTPDMQEISEEINSQILHLASVYPDGKVPPLKMKEIEGIMYTQKDARDINVMATLLKGDTSDPSGLMSRYLKRLDAVDAKPMKELDFIAQNGELLSFEPNVQTGDLAGLATEIPKELSYIKDLVELNKIARERSDAEFKGMVEKLNGFVNQELQKLDGAAPTKPKTQSFGKKVQLSGPEIIARLKAEGIKPKTPEWKARFAQLRKGEIEVSDAVNEVGRLDKRKSSSFKTDDELSGGERHFSITDAEIELNKLQKKPNPTKEDVARAQELRNQIERGPENKTINTEFESIDGEFLPTGIIDVQSSNAYKNPSVENMTKLKDKLAQINKKNGSTVITGKKESFKQKKRLAQIKRRLVKNKTVTVQRMLDNGDMNDLVDVIRASHQLAENKQKAQAPTKVEGETVVEEPQTIEVTEQVIDDLETGKLVGEDKEIAERSIEEAVEQVTDESAERITGALSQFATSGEQKMFKLAAKPKGALDYVGRMLTRITKGVGELFIDSDLTSLQYLGAKVTEIGRGFGGSIKREATASTIRDAEFKASATKLIPQYRKSIDAYANSKGKGALGRLKARERSGEIDPLVEEFNREVFTVQEYRRQGKVLPKSIDKSVTDFVDQWDYYMDHNHNRLVDANAAGFTKDRKVKHYIPHIWQAGKFKEAIRKQGREKIVELLSAGYRNLATSKNPIDAEQATKQANELIDNVLSEDFTTFDQFSPVMDTRAKQRRDIDTTATIDGMSIMDLLDTDVVGVGTKYSNRMAGWVGLAKSTKGTIRSQKDVDVFREHIKAEADEKGIKGDKYIQMYDDTIDQLFGRPTKRAFSDKHGLPVELRELKDLSALTKMGGLGTSQLIESGQVITRSVMQTFEDPKVVQQVLDMGKSGKDNRLLLEEIQSVSNITDDLEFLDRQTIHLDQTEINELRPMRRLSTKIANMATFGDVKAEASRGLGKLSGYNMVRRAQARVTQASFVLDVANHFVHGKGVMGNARMADVGLTDSQGVNGAMKQMFKKHAEWDNGVLRKLNIDKWDPAVREELQYAMIRDEAQQIQRTHVGELPPWMNRPLMGLIFQFRQMPIVANSKSLGRALAFADREAVTGVLLNAAMAGLVRYSKFAVLGAAFAAIQGDDPTKVDVTSEQTQIHKYIAQFGIFGDMNDLVLGRQGLNSIEDANSSWQFVQNQVPVAGLINDYYETASNGAKGDIEGMVDSANNLVPLSNTAIGEVMSTMLKEAYQSNKEQ